MNFVIDGPADAVGGEVGDAVGAEVGDDVGDAVGSDVGGGLLTGADTGGSTVPSPDPATTCRQADTEAESVIMMSGHPGESKYVPNRAPTLAR